MIYGLNFNGTEIPEGYRRKFAPRKKIGEMEKCFPNGIPHYAMARLVGIGETLQEKDAMLIQANNGHRALHWERRKVPGGYIYGIYAY